MTTVCPEMDTGNLSIFLPGKTDLKARISELKEQKKELKKFLTDLGEIREIGEQFNGETFRKLVDKMIVYSKENIVVRFKSGIEIKAEI